MPRHGCPLGLATTAKANNIDQWDAKDKTTHIFTIVSEPGPQEIWNEGVGDRLG